MTLDPIEQKRLIMAALTKLVDDEVLRTLSLPRLLDWAACGRLDVHDATEMDAAVIAARSAVCRKYFGARP